MDLILYCGISVQGESHKEKGVVCQDWNEIYENEGIIFAAVADGLSSSLHSDLASHEAAKFSVDYCVKRITKKSSEDNIMAVIKEAFEETQFHIRRKAKEMHYELDDVDTTLCLVIFFDGDIYYGQAGDSGIIGLREDGCFDRVTQIVPDTDGKVDPLCTSSEWKFAKYAHKVRALLLVTDGIWKMLVNPLLADQQYPLDHELLNYYMNHKNLMTISKKELDEWVENNIADLSPALVDNDDKTMVVLIDTERVLNKQNDDYYRWPGKEKLDELLKTYEESLYPYRSENNQDNVTLELENSDFEDADQCIKTDVSDINNPVQSNKANIAKKENFLVKLINNL
jgi:serine/threonine protein phosphatase PrpC